MAEQMAVTRASPSTSPVTTDECYSSRDNGQSSSASNSSVVVEAIGTSPKRDSSAELIETTTDGSTAIFGEDDDADKLENHTMEFVVIKDNAAKRQTYRQHYHSLWPQIVDDTKSEISHQNLSTPTSTHHHTRHVSIDADVHTKRKPDSSSSTISASPGQYSSTSTSPPSVASPHSKTYSSNGDFILDIRKCTSIESLNNTEHYFNHDKKSAAYFNASFRSAGLASYYESFPEGYVLCDDEAWHTAQQQSGSNGADQNTLTVIEDEQKRFPPLHDVGNPSSDLALPYTKLIYALGLANLALFALTVAQLIGVMINTHSAKFTTTTLALLLACEIVMFICLLMEVLIALALTLLARGTSLFLSVGDEFTSSNNLTKRKSRESLFCDSVPTSSPSKQWLAAKSNPERLWHWVSRTSVLTDFVFGASFLVAALLIAACFTSTTLMTSSKT